MTDQSASQDKVSGRSAIRTVIARVPKSQVFRANRYSELYERVRPCARKAAIDLRQAQPLRCAIGSESRPALASPGAPGAMAGAVGWCPGPPRPASENGSYVKFDLAAWAREAPPPAGPQQHPVNDDYGAASLPIANWSGASPDEGKFPVRPSSLTPSGAWRRTP